MSLADQRKAEETMRPVLAQNPIFARAYTPPALRRLEQRSILRRLCPRERLIVDGQPADTIFALVSGAVRMYHQSDKGDAAVMLLRAPAVFGVAEALAGVPYQEHVAAIVESEVLEMPVGEVVRLLTTEPTCALEMLVDTPGGSTRRTRRSFAST
jgi:CRP-like cAMP-binding protein